MTYNPYDPNRPTTEPNVVRDREGMSSTMIAGIIIGVALVLGIVLYAVNRDDQTASTTSSPPATTGQTQKAPSPAPAPAPPAK